MVLDQQTRETKVAKIYKNNEHTSFIRETHIFEMINRLNLETNIKFYESSVVDLSLNGNISKKMYIIL